MHSNDTALKLLTFNNIDGTNLGAIFLGYDTFLQGEILPILNYLKKKGFNILKSNVKSRLGRSEAEDIFLAENSHINTRFKWWMVNDLVTSGPMACILVHLPEAPGSCLTELNKIKGVGDPFENTQQTIRGKFKSINIAMNLIHVPEDYREFIKDTSAFFTIEEMKDLIDNKLKSNMFKVKGHNYLSKREMFELDFYSTGINNNHSFFKSLFYLKYEILKSLKINASEKDKLINSCVEFQNLIDTDRNSHIQMMREVLSIENVEVDKIISSLTNSIGTSSKENQVIDYINDFKKMHLYKKLCNESTFKDIKENDLRQLDTEGIFLPTIHKHILITSLSQWKEYSF